MDFNVYCDESYLDCMTSSRCDIAKYMAIGSIWLKQEDTQKIKDDIKELKRKYGCNGELKWAKVSRKNIDFYKEINIKNTSKYVPKKYDTPKQLGIKWQIDVKFVPICCHSNKIPEDKKFYQYTCIDEASRERFLFWYDEHTPANTVDFVKRCISYYGYKTLEIQTDNGVELKHLVLLCIYKSDNGKVGSACANDISNAPIRITEIALSIINPSNNQINYHKYRRKRRTYCQIRVNFNIKNNNIKVTDIIL